MKRKKMLGVGVLALVMVALFAGTAFAPAAAAPALQTTPDPIQPIQPDVTVVVPDTGGDTVVVTDGLSVWLILGIAGLLLLVVLVALAARGSDHTHRVD